MKHLLPVFYVVLPLIVSLLVFLLPRLANTRYLFLKNLLYMVFLVVWSVVFVYLLIRVSSWVYHFFF